MRQGETLMFAIDCIFKDLNFKVNRGLLKNNQNYRFAEEAIAEETIIEAILVLG